MNNPTPLDPDGEIDRIIDELCEYEFFNPHHEPRTMVELKQIAKSRLTRMLREARADAIKSYKNILKEEAKLKEKS